MRRRLAVRHLRGRLRTASRGCSASRRFNEVEEDTCEEDVEEDTQVVSHFAQFEGQLRHFTPIICASTSSSCEYLVKWMEVHYLPYHEDMCKSICDEVEAIAIDATVLATKIDTMGPESITIRMEDIRNRFEKVADVMEAITKPARMNLKRTASGDYVESKRWC